MSEKRVTYLIGAGASANALPVVNGLKYRLRIFLNYLTSEIDRNSGNDLVKENKYTLHSLENLIIEIEQHYTIDTLAKKYFLKHGVNKNYKFLKSLMACYFYFEQLPLKHKKLLSHSIVKWARKYEITQKYELEKKEYSYSEEYKALIKSIEEIIDYRYDSFFAALLEKIDNELQLPSRINVISWNYDSQFELAFTNYSNDNNLEVTAKKLQIYPAHNNIDTNKSCIIKLNGTASMNNGQIINDIDLSNLSLDDRILNQFRSLQYYFDNNDLPETNIKFAWEDNEQVTKARNCAYEIIKNSDVIVIIGYSFPTFNREVDREIFKGFNKECLFVMPYVDENYKDKPEIIKVKKIYIQDTPQNAPKIKERLKAVGNNLFEVAEVYDDIDQFFIPPEL